MPGNISSAINYLYCPLQPFAGDNTPGVTYSELPPAPELRNYIYCYWELTSAPTLARPYTYRVVADGCVDIFAARDAPETAMAMGFCDRHTEFSLGSSFHYVGVRFLPAAFPLFFSVSAGDLSNREACLDAISPATAAFVGECLSAEATPHRRKALLDGHFLKLLTKVRHPADHRLLGALGQIIRNGGSCLIEKELDSGVSSRHLRRLFEFYVGASPKVFSRVVRFQKAVRMLQSGKRFSDFPASFDYYDQAHFIREFRKYHGVSPGRFTGK